MSKKTLQQLYTEHTGKVSDKWSLYLTEYDRLFNEYRDKPVRLLEIGIQNGGSLEIWSKYFSNATAIVGCDINPDCTRLSYDDKRVSVVVGDANAPDIEARVTKYSPQYDIIIDDGSHCSGDIVKSFALYFSRVVDGGLFIAEDLHCSYWSQFKGGLYDPYSSMSFFKRLADVINYEHWGVDKDRNEILRGLFKQYDCEINADVLAQVHSLEFVNSICVVRKAPVAANSLGSRVIAGSEELVVQGHLALHNSPYQLASIYDQSRNAWSTRTEPPDEAIQPTEFALATAQEKNIALEQQHAALEQHVSNLANEISSIRNSTIWRITAPLRFVGAMAKKLISALR